MANDKDQNFFQRVTQGELGEVTVTVKRQSIIDLSVGITAAGVLIILFYFSFKKATNA
jgi:hypothetical protein